MRKIGYFFLLTAFFVPALQASARDARFQPVIYNEVERGFYIQGMAGSQLFLSAPVKEGEELPMIMGMTMGLAIGYDILDILQLEAFASGGQMRAPASYGGLGSSTDPHGDFSTILLGVKGRLAFLSFADSQNVRRLHLTIHAGGGLIDTLPASVFEVGNPSVLGGAGLHFFSRLRHFLIGFEVDAIYTLGVDALSVGPVFRVSYTF